MEFLFGFWTWVYAIGVASFAVLVLLVVPLGARDLLRLFRSLRHGNE